MSVVSYLPNIVMTNFDEMDEIEYCISCLDSRSSTYGTFAYDAAMCRAGLGMHAISPVYDNVDEFYLWAKDMGFRYFSTRGSFVLTKTFPA